MHKIPHLAQYQGSKRLLAGQLLDFMPAKSARLIEPFSGTAAISIASASHNRAEFFQINDLNMPLALMLREAVEFPQRLINDYKKIWSGQFASAAGHVGHFYLVREKFNAGEASPANMLYLLARCVKGSVRYGRDGKFNQSPDKRRHGTNPRKMAANIQAISSLLKGRASFSSQDYKDVLAMARPGDMIYMDRHIRESAPKRIPDIFQALILMIFAPPWRILIGEKSTIL